MLRFRWDISHSSSERKRRTGRAKSATGAPLRPPPASHPQQGRTDPSKARRDPCKARPTTQAGHEPPPAALRPRLRRPRPFAPTPARSAPPHPASHWPSPGIAPPTANPRPVIGRAPARAPPPRQAPRSAPRPSPSSLRWRKGREKSGARPPPLPLTAAKWRQHCWKKVQNTPKKTPKTSLVGHQGVCGVSKVAFGGLISCQSGALGGVGMGEAVQVVPSIMGCTEPPSDPNFEVH